MTAIPTRSGTNTISATATKRHFTGKIALTDHDRRLTYALRHKAYSHAGYLQDAGTHSFSDIYDEFETSKTVLIYRDRIPVGSARLCLMDPTSASSVPIPAMKIFHEEINQILNQHTERSEGARAVEITRLARDPECLDDVRISFALFRMVGYLILSVQSDVVFVTVTRNHEPFYRRMGYRMICPPRDYDGLDVKTGLMACFRSDFSNVQRNVAFLRGLATSDDMYKRFMSGQEIEALPEELLSHPSFRPRVHHPQHTETAA